jgi:hypothetical protein
MHRKRMLEKFNSKKLVSWVGKTENIGLIDN